MTPLDSIGSAPAPAEDCAYHPGRAAEAVCTQCARPICGECRKTVADKTVCAACVAAIRARVSAEMATPVSSAAPPPVGVVNAWAPAGTDRVAPPVVGATPPTGAGRLSVLRAIAGVALGLLLSVVGVAAWLLLVSLIKFDISLFAIGVGWLAGFGVVKGCGRGGTIPAIIGAVIALAATLSGAYLLTNGNLGFFQWFCVAFGVYQGYVVPRRAEAR
jgi:hypothetical protein